MQVIGPEIIDGMAETLVQGGRTLSLRMVPLAESLLGAIVTLQMIGFGLSAMMESWVGDQLGAVLARLCRLILMVGLVSWLITAYDDVFYQALYGLGTAIVSAISGGSGGELQTFSTAWNVYMDLLLSMWHVTESMPSALLSGGNPTTWQFWGMLLSVLVCLVVLLICLVAFSTSLVLLGVAHVMGAGLTGLALALGPVFIPWLLWMGSRPIFESWLRFLLTASFYRVVAVTLMTLNQPILVTLQAQMSQGNDPSQSQSALDILLSTLGLFVVASLTGSMMAKVPQLTQALIGHARIDTGMVSNAGRDIMKFVQKWQPGKSSGSSKKSSAGEKSRASDK
jgi:type IV secretory pathway VirB6-like protein